MYHWMHFLHATNSDCQIRLLKVFGTIAMFWEIKKCNRFWDKPLKPRGTIPWTSDKDTSRIEVWYSKYQFCWVVGTRKFQKALLIHLQVSKRTMTIRHFHHLWRDYHKVVSKSRPPISEWRCGKSEKNVFLCCSWIAAKAWNITSQMFRHCS